jgi:hypothetical protein
MSQSPRSGAYRIVATILAALPWFAPASAHAQWQPCASQGEICRFEGQALVRYGAEGRYAFRVARDRVICDHLEFGDPAYGVPKACDVNYDLNGRDGDSVAAPGLDGWTYCASEGQLCRFDGRARVRYGADNRYVYRNAANNVRCAVDVFGDPAFGVHKTCEYQLARGDYGRGDSDGGWEYCANEGGVCNFSGPGEVRYGVRGKFIVRRAVNGIPCNVDTFGQDPAYGQNKYCFVRPARRRFPD